MKLSDFEYILPKELIATHPTEPRDQAKMLVLSRDCSEVCDSYFYELPNFLKKGDVLVFNDSKVIPARLRATFDEREFEILLIKNVNGATWEAWVRPGRKAKIGEEFLISENLRAKLIKREEEIFYFEFNLVGHELIKELERVGEMPVPPYILKERDKDLSKEDIKDYQTVFAKKEGSVAAPTAGLHFTDELLVRLKEKGIQIEYVTLHVGLGTFQPVTTENVEDYKIHSEYYEIDPETAKRITGAKLEGRRVFGVGTTSVRVLESAATEIKTCALNRDCMKYGLLPKSGETNIYIYPGYNFKIIDGIITNFHLPKSSLLLLVSAFAGKENILKAYKHAINKNYKFYSYGDGMLML